MNEKKELNFKYFKATEMLKNKRPYIAINILEDLENDYKISKVYKALCSAYIFTGQYDKALEVLNKSVDVKVDNLHDETAYVFYILLSKIVSIDELYMDKLSLGEEYWKCDNDEDGIFADKMNECYDAIKKGNNDKAFKLISEVKRYYDSKNKYFYTIEVIRYLLIHLKKNKSNNVEPKKNERRINSEKNDNFSTKLFIPQEVINQVNKKSNDKEKKHDVQEEIVKKELTLDEQLKMYYDKYINCLNCFDFKGAKSNLIKYEAMLKKIGKMVNIKYLYDRIENNKRVFEYDSVELRNKKRDLNKVIDNYLKTNNLDEAVLAMELYIDLDSRNDYLKILQLANILYDLGRLDEARVLYDELLLK